MYGVKRLSLRRKGDCQPVGRQRKPLGQGSDSLYRAAVRSPCAPPTPGVLVDSAGRASMYGRARPDRRPEADRTCSSVLVGRPHAQATIDQTITDIPMIIGSTSQRRRDRRRRARYPEWHRWAELPTFVLSLRSSWGIRGPDDPLRA